MNVKVISVGNLTVGGNGKTPFVCEIAMRYPSSAIVLRGYGRQSSGLLVVKHDNEILQNVYSSGDEAMLYARMLKNTTVIVSEDRVEGINKAKELGCKLVILDDGYGKHFISKLDIVLHSSHSNTFCLPSGPYREKLWHGKQVLLCSEGEEFQRVVTLQTPYEKLSLLTAIARPQRLDEFLPEGIKKHYYEDHHYFTKEECEAVLMHDGSEALLVTYKDYVKIADFGVNCAILELRLNINVKVWDAIERYIGGEND